MRDSYEENYLKSVFFLAIFYVVASIGPQLLEETTGLHIDKYLGLIAGPATLFVLYNLIEEDDDTMMMVLRLSILFLFILMVKTVNQHFLGNSSWIYAIGIPVVVLLISYYAYNSNNNRPDSEDRTFLENIASLYLIGIAIFHIYIYFILGKNYKLLN